MPVANSFAAVASSGKPHTLARTMALLETAVREQRPARRKAVERLRSMEAILSTCEAMLASALRQAESLRAELEPADEWDDAA